MQDTRQQTYRGLFEIHFAKVKAEFGQGLFSYSEGVNRSSARKIARNRARLEMKKIRKGRVTVATKKKSAKKPAKSNMGYANPKLKKATKKAVYKPAERLKKFTGLRVGKVSKFAEIECGIVIYFGCSRHCGSLRVSISPAVQLTLRGGALGLRGRGFG